VRGGQDIPRAREAVAGGVPSRRYKFPKLAPQMRVAFASMASKTGCKSLGELEITRSTSDVAVCLSKYPLIPVNQIVMQSGPASGNRMQLDLLRRRDGLSHCR